MKTSSEKEQPIQALATLHESASLRAVTGSLLRPGGFRLTERGIAFCDFPPSARIVDIGCGTGASVAYLHEKYHFTLLGLDSSEDLLRENGQMGACSFALARAEELPLFHGVCDGILCECVLSLLLEPQRVLSEFARVLHPGGYLIISDLYDRCQEQSETTCLGKSNSVLRNRIALESLVVAAGFDLLVWEDHTNCLKELAAQLILSQDIRTDFCDFFAAFGSGSSGSSSRITTPGPGYFLLVAQKKC